MSINAAKGVEIGGGFALSAIDGAAAGDEMRLDDTGRPVFLSIIMVASWAAFHLVRTLSYV